MLYKKLYTYIVTFFLASIFATSSWGANFSFTGTFSQDDDVQLFNFLISAPATPTMRTLSYAGGTNAAGTLIPAGGFDPILSLFSSTGAFIDFSDDGDFPDVGVDPVTGNEWDSFLEIPLGPGDYVVSITQYDNFANEPNLSDGFERDGEGNFTGPEFGSPGDSFIDSDEFQRTNAWAFDILNVADAGMDINHAVRIPEPASVALLGLGYVGLAVGAARRKFKRVRES